MTILVTRPGAGKIIIWRLSNTLILAGLVLFHPHLIVAGRAQPEVTITRERLLDSLRMDSENPGGSLGGQKYLKYIRRYGVIFRMTPADERQIRRVGAHLGVRYLDNLIAAVRDKYRPKTSLTGNIEQVLIRQESDGRVQVFVRLVVKNGGHATVAQQYFVRITHATSTSFEVKCEAAEIDESFTLKQEGAPAELVVQTKDDLIRKTRQAVSRGGEESGWLRFDLPEIEQLTDDFLRQSGIWFVVSFADAGNRPYEAVFVR